MSTSSAVNQYSQQVQARRWGSEYRQPEGLQPGGASAPCPRTWEGSSLCFLVLIYWQTPWNGGFCHRPSSRCHTMRWDNMHAETKPQLLSVTGSTCSAGRGPVRVTDSSWLCTRSLPTGRNKRILGGEMSLMSELHGAHWMTPKRSKQSQLSLSC